MAAKQMHGVLRRLRELTDPAHAEASDRQLLDWFAVRHDQAAFEEVVRRHGPMVLGVCRKMLFRDEDVDDAFQATFLVLVRRAAAIPWREGVGGWLHGVACRVALKARARAARPDQALQGELPREDRMPDPGQRELHEMLNTELAGLPAKFRAPVVMCYLEGRSHAEAARELGVPKGSIAKRLAQSLELLRSRLTRRGAALAVGGIAVLLEECSQAAVPSRLAEMAVAAAMRLGPARMPGAVSANAIQLAEGVSKAMFMSKLKVRLTVGLTLGILCAAAGVGMRQVLIAAGTEAKPPAEKAAPAQPPGGKGEARPGKKTPPTDPHGDPLPPGALARMGTDRLQQTGMKSLAFTADGKAIVTVAPAPAGPVLVFWDRTSGKELRRLQIPNKADGAVCLSPDGATLAVGEPAGKLRLWDTATGKELPALPPNQRPNWGKVFHAMQFSADGKAIAVMHMVTEKRGATASSDSRWLLWDLTTCKELGASPKFPSLTHFAILSSDLRSTALLGPGVLVQETTSGKVRQRAGTAPKGDVTGAEFSRDGRMLAVRAGGDVIVWDVANGKELHRLAALPGQMNQVAFSADGKVLATSGWTAVETDRGQLKPARDAKFAIQLYDVATGKKKEQLLAPVDGTLQHYWHDVLQFAPDGKHLAARSLSGIYLWDLATGKLCLDGTANRPPIGRVGLTADGKILVSVGREERTVRVWDAATGKAHVPVVVPEPIQALALSPDGKLLAVDYHLKNAGTIGVWDLATGKPVAQLPAGARSLIAFAASSQDLLARNDAKPMPPEVWSLQAPKRPTYITKVDDARLASLTPDQKAAVMQVLRRKEPVLPWDLQTGKERGLERAYVRRISVSPDGRLMAGKSVNGAIGLWDVDSGERLHLFPVYHGHGIAKPNSDWGRPVKFSPDGKLLALIAERPADVILLWDTATGKNLGRFLTGQGQVTSLAFSADSKRLVSGGKNGTALVWDCGSPEPPAPPVERTTEQMEALWKAIVPADVKKVSLYNGYRELWTLAASKNAAGFMKGKVSPVPLASDKELDQLLADLDSTKFDVRAKATTKLVKLGPAAEVALNKALENKPSLELRKRIDAILKKLPAWQVAGYRSLRAVEALEYAPDQDEARQLLAKLAKGNPAAALTREARAALERLDRRLGKKEQP